MIPPKPEFNASHVIGEDGISRPMNLYQRIEAKLDHLIECAHAAPGGLCPECYWASGFSKRSEPTAVFTYADAADLQAKLAAIRAADQQEPTPCPST